MRRTEVCATAAPGWLADDYDAMNVTRGIGLLVALLVFLIDQGTKYAVTGPLGLNYVDASMTVLPIFDLRFV